MDEQSTLAILCFAPSALHDEKHLIKMPVAKHTREAKERQHCSNANHMTAQLNSAFYPSGVG